MKTHKLKAAEAEQRLDVIASQWLGLNRSQAAKAIRSGQIKLNDQIVKTGYTTAVGDRLSYEAPTNAAPKSPLKLKIVYEDASILVIDKPAGLMVHPASNNSAEPTVVDFARSVSRDEDADRPGIVHRLDRDTSGLLIIAKTAVAKAKLQADFRKHKIEKEYIVLADGHLPQRQAEIRLPIAASRGMKRQIHPSGKAAVTRYLVAEQYPTASLVKAWPQSGRTHQIRVHFAAIGHPVIGDKLYGQADPALSRHFLHAHKLAFRSPSGAWVEVTSPLPGELKSYLAGLK